ncbi:hypothetical protein [Thermodesulfovibrio yellowstonii]|uniref:Uncharacterized protein n=1 Tax=Thermodesulfovibrio yellowstonii TaxID=28262 RepID=A0A9W6LKY4_9BACT|nr:hypothetical protein [Thermodesulfovibrio islandicus]GLI54124.1 hypothetical protein TISLANDTSLP1_18170 [Thermodesulfovibrio islandicus]
MKQPEWALKYKTKGTELRLIGGTYYLYEVSSKWSPHKKRAQKITGRLLGKITPEGFIQYNFQHSYLSTVYPDVSVTDKKISSLLRVIGEGRQNISAFLKKYIVNSKNDYMIIDATHLLSYSEDMEIAKPEYNNHKFSPQDLLMRLREIKKVRLNDSWYTSEITSKTKKLIEKLNIHIT